MTTIAYRFPYVACDSACFNGSTRTGRAQKIFQTDAGLVAITGETARGHALVRWLKGERDRPEASDDGSAIVIAPDGTLTIYEGCYEPHSIEADVYCRGSGMDFALGALAAGASVVRAVEIACQLDAYSDHPIQLWDVRIGQMVEATPAVLSATVRAA